MLTFSSLLLIIAGAASVAALGNKLTISKLTTILLERAARSSLIESADFKAEDEKFDIIRKQADSYYGTLPRVIFEDAILSVPELIQKYGYPIETHVVTSPDGYILTLHRIPYGRKGPSKNRPAVYLQHGLLCSSADWIISGPDKGFGYILTDAGYDVWMPNVRGTTYSRNSTYLDPDNDAAKFWDFSWHEIALYDVTTMIDYVIAQTKQEQIFYIGHSQGTTVFYVMCSERPEYNKKIRAQFSLAPVAYMGWMTSPLLRIIALAEGGLEFILNMIGMHEFLPNNRFLAEVADVLCGDHSIFQILCTNSLFALCGFNSAQMNATLIPIMMGHTPAGASTKQLLHFAQEVNSRKFRQWDYGFFGNIKYYDSSSPPKYQLKRVTAPVYLYYSKNDWLSNEKDVTKLYKELKNVKGRLLVADYKFNHLDYLFGIDAPELLYQRVIGLMKRH